MAYMEQLQSGLKYLTAAGETGRRSLDGMLGPVNGAIGEISGAASEIDIPHRISKQTVSGIIRFQVKA